MPFFIVRWIKRLVVLTVVISIVVGIYNVYKPLPIGVRVEGTIHQVSPREVEFFADTTFVDVSGTRHSSQIIFDEFFNIIDGAQRQIVIDAFLYNDYQGTVPETTRALSRELTNHLLEKKKAAPNIEITLITDPINETYHGDVSEQFEELRGAGIKVVTTDLTILRDSNPLYSGFWRTVLQWFTNSPEGNWLPHPFQYKEKVGIRSYLTLFNFKANHRKLVVADQGNTFVTLITSGNPHDGSSAHGNIAIKVMGNFGKDVVMSESAVAVFSGSEALTPTVSDRVENGEVAVELLTEGAIRDHLVDAIKKTISGDTIDMAMFYLSERTIVKELVEASKRGVSIRLLLDPNKDAFGHQKNGVPNRPVAHELLEKTKPFKAPIQIRWCDTHGEQCHAKLTLIKTAGGFEMIGGSANLTRRNIKDYNLETNVSVRSAAEIPAITNAYTYFETLWENRDGKTYSTNYATYADSSFYKKVMYRVMELTGLSSF